MQAGTSNISELSWRVALFGFGELYHKAPKSTREDGFVLSLVLVVEKENQS